MLNKLVPVEQKVVNFNGAELMAVKCSDGKIYVGMQWIGQGIGFTKAKVDGEIKKAKDDRVLSMGIRNLSVKFDAQVRESTCIDIEFLPLWLAKISITPTLEQEQPEVADKMVEYQLKAKDALAKAFLPTQMAMDSYMIEDPIKRAERWIEEQREKQALMQKIEEDKPLVTFAETALKSNDNILVRELAKVMYDQGIEVGEKRLYKWLRSKKLVMSGSTEPYQSALDMGLFVREEKPVKTPYGERLVFTTKVTPKGQVYIVERYREEMQKLPANVSQKVSA